MELELKQVITQIIAFLIMLWILKRYLWKPLMSLMDERAQSIQASFQEAEQKNNEAELRLEEYNKKIEGIKEEGQEIIQAAVQESQKIGHQIQQEAHRKAHETINRAQEQTKLDLEKARIEFKKESVDLLSNTFEKLVKVKLTDEDKARFNLELVDEV